MNEEVLETFQNYLPVLRAANKITQEQLGKMLGISKEAICHFENKRSKLKLSYYIAMRMIFEALSCANTDDLVTPHVFDLVDSKMDGKYVYWFDAVMKLGEPKNS